MRSNRRCCLAPIVKLLEKPKIGNLAQLFLMGTLRGSTRVQCMPAEQWQYFDAECQLKTARRRAVYFHGLGYD